ncbi:MAG: RagB/SusD family nutrient uptake outer membrane protein [Paludibacter sp.]|nr:RagB/SusD family nutrient uptake outer membrane protein [Paludibacter sp.]
MNKINNILIYLLVVISISSCGDFLDTLPDNRTQLNNEKKITQLLVSAYPGANYSVLAELSSDNFVDNNAILPVILSSFERMHDEIFAWQEVTSSTQEDSPSYVWEKCYAAISAANHALEAIDSLENNDSSLELSAQKGEALLCRAYGHFILVNIFSQAYKDETASTLDLGIPYITKSETVVQTINPRETVASVYTKIQKDIEDGIGLISDQNYSVPKYHFNKKAAAAFAARFFLYKRDYQKVLNYADDVLTADPTNLMRDWTVNYDNMTAISYDYINTQLACNFLILPTSSVFSRIFGTRYGHNGAAMYGSTYGSGPTWTGALPCFTGKLYISGQQDYGVFFPKADEMFEYTDKVAGIGFAHVVRAEFTAEETLLCRAEALIYLNRIPEAVADLQIWNKSHMVPNDLTEALIKSFYVTSNTLFVKTLNSTKMSSSFVISATQLPFINCVLHFRRIETMFDGYRWFDIKRYGIEIEHSIANAAVDKLLYNDERRAIQLPQEVISAGVEANPRLLSPVSSSNYSLFIAPTDLSN